MSPITAHVLDTALGKPAVGLRVQLAVLEPSGARELAVGQTDRDGRLGDLLPASPLPTGSYRLRFETGDYFLQSGRDVFYPSVEVVFRVATSAEHYHIPLLLSPYGYTTYRGS
jgi:5-hydroxyisourate hydrolase